MPIQDVGGMKQVLQNYSAKDWSKSANLKTSGLEQIKGTNLDFSGQLGGTQKPQSFGQMLAGSIAEVNNLQVEANTAIEKLVSGRSQNLHETMLAVEKAEIAFRTMNQVRQKVIDAYQEVMRMQV